MKKPVIHPTAFVAPNATLRGDISLAADSSVFYGAVLRGDTASITIGEGSNIQDNCVIHVAALYARGSFLVPVTCH